MRAPSVMESRRNTDPDELSTSVNTSARKRLERMTAGSRESRNACVTAAGSMMGTSYRSQWRLNMPGDGGVRTCPEDVSGFPGSEDGDDAAEDGVGEAATPAFDERSTDEEREAERLRCTEEDDVREAAGDDAEDEALDGREEEEVSDDPCRTEETDEAAGEDGACGRDEDHEDGVEEDGTAASAEDDDANETMDDLCSDGTEEEAGKSPDAAVLLMGRDSVAALERTSEDDALPLGCSTAPPMAACTCGRRSTATHANVKRKRMLRCIETLVHNGTHRNFSGNCLMIPSERPSAIWSACM